MSQESVEKTIGRLLTDDYFRLRASLHLEILCHKEGYDLSDEELRMIKKIHLPSLSDIAENLDGGIKRFDVRTVTPAKRKQKL
jgi:hypothetical protein